MRYRILGALHVLGQDGQPCALDRRQSRILAVLLLTPNQLVGRDYLIDAVWDTAPPATAPRQLQNCISALRQRLPGGGNWKHVIAAEPAGYRIRLDTGQLDAQVFEAGVADAQQQQAAGRIADAAAKLRDALALWQGPALAGLTGRAIEAGSARLNEQRLTIVEDCLDLELRQGRHHQVVSELIELVAEHPLREFMVGLLMRALHGSGRQSEALHAYDLLRRRLDDELGLDPGPQLQELHASILRNAVPVAAAPPAAVTVPAATAGPTALRQLPAPVRHFVGRDEPLAALDRLVDATGRDAVVIAVVHGTGGIGKTALAVRWAHRAAPGFPDGQLFVNLRGFDPTREPVTPAEAIRGFLDAFAIPADQIPLGLDAQASLYRSLLAERRMLIVLDNARHVDQVRPLLPGSSGCLVVVTSRNQLTGLVAVEGAQPITLDLLTTDEAGRLLAGHLGEARVAAEPGAVGELVSRCAQLPLALAIIAARAAAHPTFPLATFSAELADAQRRLDAVDGGDQFSQVRSVFSWSYQRLPTRAAALFRLLGLHRGPDITVPAAASLAGIPAGQARQLLTDLSRAHLVSEHATGRYAFHDLLSAYAMEQAEANDTDTDRRLAVRRLLGYDLHAASAADALVAPHRRRTPGWGEAAAGEVPAFGDHDEALAWFEVERGNLVAAVRLAWEHREYEIGWRLANLLWGLFHLEKHWDDWIGTHTIGLACARGCADRRAEFTMLSSLGTAYREREQFAEATRCHQQALRLSREIGDRHGEAQALNGLGAVCGDQHQLAEARRYLLASLEIRRQVGDRWGEAITICNLGEEDLHAGDLESARERFLEALAIRREIGDRWGEATALSYLGQACQAAGDHAEAARSLTEALMIHRELRAYSMEALDLHHLGVAFGSLGEAQRSAESLREALAIYRRLGMAAAVEVELLLAEE
ncbi:DNA-binding SARP family transcriptional activator/tetratricopeptide (TPR) repeat protein [Allocatelliglobosispora scoriae]|uniref:DNA-binding SARP family transcriptional activator/tetratricopeptide (TPR) repeat protein n=1 Tax=Allocatelliglobosispora scoriae TaxID=643052 RepID=A0A841BMZ2_9ACTN|nr:BTAD domain-containing putative transcriptional regulator [Allocatelliglobosispora scoriae]MBB5868748.1 DNA-binding SARP family transcriptional activator/tetratricopeptide (TPR) repeat protein [Allocatelliglobosispora scoriae]